jgi:hypothetical protein
MSALRILHSALFPSAAIDLDLCGLLLCDARNGLARDFDAPIAGAGANKRDT